jgi:hypothetical protein
VTSLTLCGRAFALVGGLAVTVRSEVVTATVEHETQRRLATARLRGPSAVVCDLLFASSGIEHEAVARATPIEVAPGLAVAVARVEELLAMKLLASAKARPQDEQDFIRLIEFNPDLDEAALRANIDLITARGYSRGDDLPRKLEACLARAREALDASAT